MHVVIVFWQVFITNEGEAETAAKAFVKAMPFESENDLKAYILLSEATNALFGGTSLSDITIKFVSRGLPLISAPLRVRLAFIIRQVSVSYDGTGTSTVITTPDAGEEAAVDVSSARQGPPQET